MGNSTVERLRSKSTKVLKIKDVSGPEDEEPYEFKIQRLSSIELIESQELTSTLGSDIDKPLEELQKEEIKEGKITLGKLKTSVIPMMKKLLPIATLDPKIVFRDQDIDGDNTIHARIIPDAVLYELFNQIMKFSGFDKEKFEELKKKQQTLTPKT